MSNFIRKNIFKLSYLLKRPLVIKSFREALNSEFLTIAEKELEQERKLKILIDYCYKNIPYYTKLMDTLALKVEDVQSLKDLERFPILTKDDIRNSAKDFIPINGYSKRVTNGSTGGSTGEPLKYKMSDHCYSMGVACLYRGWGKAGYELGDKLVVIAGGSLVSKKQSFKQKAIDWLTNIRHYSSYGIDEEVLSIYADKIASWNAKFLRGYATSIYEFAKFVDERNLASQFNFKGIFTTAEMLTNAQRLFIERVFSVKVYNNYGLNDGGISGYECNFHNGFHIDTERAVLECVNDQGFNVVGEKGRLVATSLLNFDMPFIRYDTGDIGIVAEDFCRCKNESKLLKELSGRITDTLTINGKIVGSPVLTILMGKVDLKRYQILQLSDNAIVIKIEPGAKYDFEGNEVFIRSSLFSQLGEFDLEFLYTDQFESTSGGKHKFIVKAK